MNKLPVETRVQILSMLCEGSSMRSISRVCDVSFNTVAKLLVDAGKVCSDFHDERVRKVKARNVACDEIWSFNYCKGRNVKKASSAPEGAGDVWTWTAIDSDTKLMISWLVGSRNSHAANHFLRDLRSRVAGEPQITTDGHKPYIQAVAAAFGPDVDYAMLVKIFGPETAVGPEKRYSPPVCIGAEASVVSGYPDLSRVNTSFAERQNLTMRMSMRRFTRLTNAFSKKFENHCHALALYFVWYNWIRTHKTLRMTPAMAAGLTDKLMDWSDIVLLMDVSEREAVLDKRGMVLRSGRDPFDRISL
ncbi:MAG: DDE-type integrase/transposase/recombinase [Alphaproteobacteria bacterium]